MPFIDSTIAWLLEGDPAIRWQTLRDLQFAPERQWKRERQRTLREGWGAKLLALQEPSGQWGGGLYSPKWISTTYTLLTLCALGIPPRHKPAQNGIRLILDQELGTHPDQAFRQRLARMDRCVVGMNLQLAAYFGVRDARVEVLVENLLEETMPDGAWNCRRGRADPHHSSFHTTFNVLEGLREWLDHNPTHGLRREVLAAEQQALEFVLQHRLFKSDHTGQVIDPHFVLLSFPPRWHYDVLRGLDYFARRGAPYDDRLQDAVNLLYTRRRRDGTWPVQHKYSGRVFFDMEKTGGPSRWNTLRALRVLHWWEQTRTTPAVRLERSNRIG